MRGRQEAFVEVLARRLSRLVDHRLPALAAPAVVAEASKGPDALVFVARGAESDLALAVARMGGLALVTQDGWIVTDDVWFLARSECGANGAGHAHSVPAEGKRN